MRSMTAFGRASGVSDGREIIVEIKSVNNRYLDWNIRLPRLWSGLEEAIRIFSEKSGIHRGKIDLSVTLSEPDTSADTGKSACFEPDLTTARCYVEAARLLSAELSVGNDLTVSRLLSLPGVMVPKKEEETQNPEAIWAMILPVLSEAIAAFTDARKEEGDRLGQDLQGKLTGIRRLTSAISARSETNALNCRSHFEDRLRTIIGETGVVVDENRLLTECAVLIDHMAIDEELVRLHSHFDALDGLFASDEPVGRRIDFLLQEINREVNTIGSKCQDAVIAQTVTEIKSELEKIREQIQNIE